MSKACMQLLGPKLASLQTVIEKGVWQVINKNKKNPQCFSVGMRLLTRPLNELNGKPSLQLDPSG